jgi:hypothetical protein
MLRPVVELRSLDQQNYNFKVVNRSVKISAKGLGMSDVVKIVKDQGIEPSNIEAITSGRPGDYGTSLVFKRSEDVDLLKGKSLSFRGQPVHFVALGKQIVSLKLHWLPLHINDTAIHEMLSPFGHVLDVKRLSFLDKNVRMSNGIRLVTFEVSEVERRSIPHLLKFDDGLSVLQPSLQHFQFCRVGLS